MSELPRHIAIIMDGNRRWTKKRRMPVFAGHKKGEDRIEPIIDYAIKLGIPFLTFWAFSTDNWYRTKREVSFLLNLYRNSLNKKIGRFHLKKVKIHVIGNLSLFPPDLVKKTKEWMEKTKDNKAITVNIALSYGGRDEIIRAVEKLRVSSKFKVQSSKLTESEFENYLDTAGQPDPDLLIRTGGEQRLSGFLLWQLNYAELYFTQTLWPDFTPEKFKEAIDEYLQRQRRFGK